MGITNYLSFPCDDDTRIGIEIDGVIYIDTVAGHRATGDKSTDKTRRILDSLRTLAQELGWIDNEGAAE